MPLPIYLMTNFPSVRPSLNLQFDSQPTPADMTSHLASVGATFSRASIGTYTDANGIIQEATTGQARPNYSSAGVHEGLLIEESRTNLIKSSEDFTVDWTVVGNTTITTNQAIAPDGTASADVLTDNSTGGFDRIESSNVTFSATTYTGSIYVKKTTGTPTHYPGIQIGNTGSYLILNTTTGAVNETNGTDHSDFEGISFNDDWWYFKFSRTMSAGTANGMRIWSAISTNGTTISTNATGSATIWGAQLEAGSFPTSYIPTIPTFTSRASNGTYFDSSGVLQTASTDEERIDHKYIDGQWVEAGLLLEGASTNEYAYSEDLTTTWSDTNGTISSNQISAPDGNTTADELEATATSSVSYVFQTINFAVADYTISVFAKESSSSVLWLYVRSGGEQGIAYFDLSDQTTQAVAGSSTTPTNLTIEDVGNGWYRCSATFDNTTATNSGSGIGVCDAKGSASVTAGKSVYIWGAQLEEQSQPTSYIPTTTASATRSADVYTTATKQRSADVCYIDGTAFTDFYNQDEGTFFLIERHENEGSTTRILNGDTGNDAYFYHTSSSAYQVRTFDGSNVNIIGSRSEGELANIAIKYDGTNSSGAVNGTVDSSPSSFSLSTQTELNIGSLVAQMFIKKLIYFPRQLSDNELTKLTQ